MPGEQNSNPAPAYSDTRPLSSRTEVYNVSTPSSAEVNASLLEKIAIQDIKDLRESVIRGLSGYAIGKRPTTSTSDGRILKKFREERADWVPVFPLSTLPRRDADGNATDSEVELYQKGEYPVIGLMPLKHAIYIAEQMTNSLDPTSGTTWFNPLTTDTVEMARLLALNAVFLLDNPEYHYTGNEADMSMFGLNILKQLHIILNRSLGGFFTGKLTESTTNIERRDVGGSRDSNGMMARKENGTDKFLHRLR